MKLCTDQDRKTKQLMLSRMPSIVHLYNLSAPTLTDLKMIKEKVENDGKLKKIIEELRGQEEQVEGKFSIRQGVLRYKDRLVIS